MVIPKKILDSTQFNKEVKRLQALTSETQKLQREMKSLIEELTNHSELPAEVEENISELKSKIASLHTLSTNARSYSSQIEAYYTNYETVKAKIDKEQEEAEAQNEILSKHVVTSKELIDSLTDEITRGKELLSDATKTLEFVTNGALSSVFSARSERISKSRKCWMWGVFVASILFFSLLCLVIFGFLNSASDYDNLSVWLMKVALIVPFAYLLYFVISQYNKERNLEERYAFKSLISQTINNNTKLLKDEFLSDENENEEIQLKIVNFTIQSLSSVYKEPFDKQPLSAKLGLGIGKAKADVNVTSDREVSE